ncbi:hypothetical protein [Nocardiopsis suaedae]|uniref:Uncharacterized protein n=1 Tax=Nocardiopsis suaedae TaxID=3018444 RepID=A0ABT4TMR5_9ACTN|nr:hypothetical protein [Nocardiopsis suaedae]MDA2805685.1 hypothetical protein [Nocardiopsis suaedae]
MGLSVKEQSPEQRVARPQPPPPSAPRRPGRHAAARDRGYRDRIPNFGRFCEVASRHRGDWWITYDHGSPTPYRAQNRRAEDVVITTSDVDVLDDALTALSGVAYARPYVPATEADAAEPRQLSATVREVA